MLFFGIRGSGSHQELIAFLKFKSFFPKIKNIIILSGLNDLFIATEKNTFFIMTWNSYECKTECS